MVSVTGFHGSSFKGPSKSKFQKKKVLTNKELTKKVRSLSGKEGARAKVSGFLYTADTLTAGTPDINYFDDAATSLFNTANQFKHHYYDVHVKLIAAADASVRIIYGFDENWDGTNLIATEILATATDSASPYATANGFVASLKESKHKNRADDYRCVVVKDMLIPIEAGVQKCFNMRLPLYNRVSKSSASDTNIAFFPFICALADESNVTITMGVNYWRTDMSA